MTPLKRREGNKGAQGQETVQTVQFNQDQETSREEEAMAHSQRKKNPWYRHKTDFDTKHSYLSFFFLISCYKITLTHLNLACIIARNAFLDSGLLDKNPYIL